MDVPRLKATLKPIAAVVGPTASGKTEIALSLARRLGGEILSADMGQLYRRLDAGTAKPEGRWEDGVYRVGGVPYHLVDLLDPSERTDAGRYAALARPVLEAVRGRGKMPIIVGGTGLYLRALLEGLHPLPARNAELRERLARVALEKGRAFLHEELQRLDPESARRIPPGNIQRVIRALEVVLASGTHMSKLLSAPRASSSPAGEVVYFGLEYSSEDLRVRIRARAESMFPRMIQEVARLVPAEYTGAEPGFRCLGYPEALACRRGELSFEESLSSMVRATTAYARRQRTWFRGQVQVRWLDPAAGPERIAEELL
ncbi:MAG: tRNA (adenosine(37)-N6)-dimethylallyltransferase MiaA [Elusimicrobia bacterium]|nr:tRNA (adenosine(37)-N6)-dimethylallyltransferase MiaA [Elusimicrobiota bacterium]